MKIDSNVFIEQLLNTWSLVTFIRYGHVFGLYSDDSLKGFAIFLRTWDNPRLINLVEIAIDKKSQGKGCGCYLLVQSLLDLKKSGLTNVVLTVDPNNAQAQHIYCDKFGFEFIEYRKNEYGQGRDRLFLGLNLEKWTSEPHVLKSMHK